MHDDLGAVLTCLDNGHHNSRSRLPVASSTATSSLSFHPQYQLSSKVRCSYKLELLRSSRPSPLKQQLPLAVLQLWIPTQTNDSRQRYTHSRASTVMILSSAPLRRLGRSTIVLAFGPCVMLTAALGRTKTTRIHHSHQASAIRACFKCTF